MAELRRRAEATSEEHPIVEQTQQQRELPKINVLGCELERNAVLAALGAVAITATLLGIQYCIYVFLLAPAPLEEGELPFIS